MPPQHQAATGAAPESCHAETTMFRDPRSGRRLARVAALVAAVTLGAHVGRAQPTPAYAHRPPPTFSVDGQIALHSLVSLSDGHLRKLADVLTMIAGTDAARMCDWDGIHPRLAEAARVNVPAALWFALPDGNYWTVKEGHVAGTLSDRSYFPHVLAGETVIGSLVVSRSTNRNTAIVAVPVLGQEHEVVGVLGASVHLDSLAAVLRQEMGGLGDGLLFFAIDEKGLGALNSEPSLIFTEPLKLGDSGMRQAFEKILADQQGVVTYEFRGAERTVLYQRSPISNWSYGFGRLHR
jgi:hypothetical protein